MGRRDRIQRQAEESAGRALRREPANLRLAEQLIELLQRRASE